MADWQYPEASPETGDYPQYGHDLPERYKHWRRVPRALRSSETTVVYVGIPDERGNRSYWNLAGPRAGSEGVTLAQEASGLEHAPFKTAWHESAWQVGATAGHTSYPKRPLNLGVIVGVPPRPKTIAAEGGRLQRIVPADTEERYRLISRRWWSAWSPERDGSLGVFTRAFGWRWLTVRLAEEPKAAMSQDPVAFGNNARVSDLPLVAAFPFFRKLPRIATWRNNESTATPLDLVEEVLGNLIPGLDTGEGKLVVRNDGDFEAYPKFLIDPGSGGYVWLQDGMADRMVRLPKLYSSDGLVLVDTEPGEMTLTSSKDPVDLPFLGLLKKSQLLDFVMHDILEPTEPLWKRGADVFFTSAIPPRTTTTLTVRASNAKAVITVKVPQCFDGPGL